MTLAEHGILFVDDEEHILKSLRRLLRKEPYRFYLADSGEAGLKLLEENPDIQMVVSDQRMPGMCGTEFLAKVKEKYPDTVRIVLSGYAEPHAVMDAINQGEVFRFIAKPWDDESLKTTIRQCLDHYDIVMENRRLTEQTIQQMEQLQNLNQLLENSVQERTHSLHLSQEILDSLPMMVMGVSLEEELVLTNNAARENLAPLQSALPGTEIADLMPEDLVEKIRRSLNENTSLDFDLVWEEQKFQARTSRLGAESQPRGCIVVLEEAD
jgi:response regulator RpfG family c-di-GMP phosphodiesterase